MGPRGSSVDSYDKYKHNNRLSLWSDWRYRKLRTLPMFARRLPLYTPRFLICSQTFPLGSISSLCSLQTHFCFRESVLRKGRHKVNATNSWRAPLYLCVDWLWWNPNAAWLKALNPFFSFTSSLYYRWIYLGVALTEVKKKCFQCICYSVNLWGTACWQGLSWWYILFHRNPQQVNEMQISFYFLFSLSGQRLTCKLICIFSEFSKVNTVIAYDPLSWPTSGKCLHILHPIKSNSLLL